MTAPLTTKSQDFEYQIEQSLTGFSAFQAYLSTLQSKGGSWEIWIKADHDKFFVGGFDQSGRFDLWSTNGAGKDRVRVRNLGDAFTYLDKLSRRDDGGVFYIPTQPQGFPLAECVTSTDDIGWEMDDLSFEAQYAKYLGLTH